MKKMTQHSLLLVLAMLVGMMATAAVPSGYYNNASGKSDRALMTALHTIIKGHTKRSYDQLWTDFRSTDCNGTTIIDRYSNSQFTYQTDRCGNYSGVGDCYNREHTIPNSWWGSSSSDTAYTDLHHLFPVDGFVNGKRGNYPLGDCNGGTTYGTGKLGNCTYSGYSGTVFEVADEYKGDFARVYFYFATRYMMRMSTYTQGLGSVVFTSSSYLGLTSWAINQLLEWHRNDPVSTLETTRNDAVYSIQKNRNPFIDHPELVEYIWGNKKGTAWTGSGSTTTPVLTSPTSGSTVNVGTNTGSGVSKSITVKGSNLTKALSISVSGTGFSANKTMITAANANNGTTVTVTYDGTATSATGTLTISSSEVSSTVSLTASYSSGGGGDPVAGEETIETWEGISGYGSYSTTSIRGAAFNWNTNDVGIWNSDTNKNGTQSCRFGKTSASYIEMAQDVSNGATRVTFYAAKWGSDDAPTLQLLYSTNGGNSWTSVGTCSPGSSWQQYSFDLNVTGNVRFKILQTAGERLNIDDIAITSNNGPVATPELTAPTNGSTVNVGTIAATGTAVSKTIMVKGSDLTKALSVSVSGRGFSVTPSIISATSANAGTTVTVTYSSTTAGSATGTLTIGSSEVNCVVNLTASKIAMPTIAISALDVIETQQNADSPIIMGTVTTENNDENITLQVNDAKFELSLNRSDWSNQLTLDPSGEVFYVRLASTSTLGEFNATISASTTLASAYADVTAVVNSRLGDVNMDGAIDVSDVTALIAHILGTEVTPFNEAAADVTSDSSIDVSDVTALIAIILGNNPSTALLNWYAVPAADGVLVNNPMGETLEVFDLDANCVATVNANGLTAIQLPSGIYLVSSDTVSRKVVVK